MRYKVLVEGPLTQSGYGEHSNWLKLSGREDILDICKSIELGYNRLVLGDDDQRTGLILCSKQMPADNLQNFFDIHIHIGIPHEFSRKGKFCTHVTAGIETTKVSKAGFKNTRDGQVVVPSEFAKWV